jgi:hypothetical protein
LGISLDTTLETDAERRDATRKPISAWMGRGKPMYTTLEDRRRTSRCKWCYI